MIDVQQLVLFVAYLLNVWSLLCSLHGSTKSEYSDIQTASTTNRTFVLLNVNDFIKAEILLRKFRSLQVTENANNEVNFKKPIQMNLSLYLTTIRNILCYNLSYSSESEYGRRLQFFWILLTIDWISLIVKNNRCQVNFSVTHRNESNCGVIRFDFIQLNQINSHLYSSRFFCIASRI